MCHGVSVVSAVTIDTVYIESKLVETYNVAVLRSRYQLAEEVPG